ncbi:glycine betaine-binding protein OpuAC precursor [Peptococcaceae bacterium CEB3]|nr:glycine betaine-binding protein OpuAC precursor [Peptococcaceae bacterium CEB3]
MQEKGLRVKGKMGNFLLIGLLIFVLLLSGCSPQAGSQAGVGKPTVKIGYVNWQEDIAVTYLWQVLLQEKGYDVQLRNLDVAPLYVGLSRGDLDLFLDAWLPVTQRTYWQRYRGKLEDLGVWYEGEAKVGLVVPQYVTINSIADLNKSQARFGGKIIGIDPGAGEMKTVEQAVKGYGLNYQLIPGSEAAMLAALGKAYREKQWIVVTGWSPHWMFAKYRLKYLADPKISFGQAENLHVLANKSFARKQPAVVNLLKNFKLSDRQVGSLESLLNTGMPPRDAAKKWLTDNQATVKEWLK